MDNHTPIKHGQRNLGRDVLLGVTSLVMIGSLYATFCLAPTERVMGDVQRIFYLHLASAWVGFAAFFVAFATSIMYLRQRNWIFDLAATAAVEIGLLFCTITLVSGTLWARPIWNTWWTWDPRLTTTLVLWLYYLGVLALRHFIDQPDARSRYAAVLSIVGFANVPLVFMAIRWWRTIHPVVLTAQGMALEPRMLVALFISLAAYSLLFVCLLLFRIRLAKLSARTAMVRSACSTEENAWIT